MSKVSLSGGRLRVLGTDTGVRSREPVQLRSAVFRKEREQIWRQLECLLRKTEEDGIASLTAEEAEQLPLLYRQTISSLSAARNLVLDRNLLVYLENLSLRAYLIVYGPRTGLRAAVREFVTESFPRQVRALRYHLLFAAAVFFAAALWGFFLTAGDSSLFFLLVPEQLDGGRGPDAGYHELRASLFAPFPGFVSTFLVFSGFLIQHNALLGILCFGLGAVFGLPAVLLLSYSGMSAGAMTAVFAGQGLTLDFLAWLLIHGVTEILAILLCAAAGLSLAEKWIFPGELTRLDSLARAGRSAAGTVLGAVGLFFIAGILEGGFRQLINNSPLRLAAALASGAVWLWYFTRAGKEADDDSAG